MPGSANYNLSAGLQYDLTLAGNDAYFRGDYHYIGKYYSDFAEAGQAAGGYGQIHLKAGVTLDNFEVDLFVNNLTNENDLTWVESLWGGFGLANRGYRLKPRTVGIKSRIPILSPSPKAIRF